MFPSREHEDLLSGLPQPNIRAREDSPPTLSGGSLEKPDVVHAVGPRRFGDLVSHKHHSRFQNDREAFRTRGAIVSYDIPVELRYGLPKKSGPRFRRSRPVRWILTNWGAPPISRRFP